LSSLFSIFGLISATIDYEVSFSPERTHDNCKEIANDLHRYLTLTFTIVAIAILCARHYLKARWYNLTTVHNKVRHIVPYKKWFSGKLFMEIVVLLVFPYPAVRGSFKYQQSQLKEINEDYDNTITLCYTVSEILYFLMFFRIIFLIRTLFNYTPYQDNHARSHCIYYKTKANVRFSVRSMMKAHPLIMIYFSIFPSFFLFGTFLRIFERPYADISGKNYDSLQNAAWNSFVTMATIGFGELYPSTLPGRCVGIACAMWGAYAFSMVVFTITTSLELNANQIRALTEIKITRTAGKVICKLVAYYIAKKKQQNPEAAWKQVLLSLDRFDFNMRRIKALKTRIGYKEYVPKHKIRELESKLKDLNNKLLILIENPNSMIKH
jgi:hypothetical protein